MVSLSVKCMKHSKATETIPRQRSECGKLLVLQLLPFRDVASVRPRLWSDLSMHLVTAHRDGSGSRAYVSCIAWVSHVANTVSPFV